MKAGEQADLVLPFARVLYVNGQATEQTVSAAERLARALGLRATIMPHWGELQLLVDDKHGTVDRRKWRPIRRAWKWTAWRRRCGRSTTSKPAASARCRPESDRRHLALAAAPTWLFALAAAAGAVALAVIFGVEHFAAAILIFVSAGAGAILRRALGRLSSKSPPTTVLRGDSRRHHRRDGGPLRPELVAAPCRGLSVHGPGAWSAFSQRCARPRQRPNSAWRRPLDVCRADRRRDLGGTAARTGPARRFACRPIRPAEPFRCGKT